MENSVALQRYLQRHIESPLPASPQSSNRWHNTLVIPAYRESPGLIQRLRRLGRGKGQTLVILVLNRPDTDHNPQANSALRVAAAALPATHQQPGLPPVYSLNGHTDLYVHDMEEHGHLVPASQGVGLARKTGCDIAVKWMSSGAISGRWIHSSDADAGLPPDYFRRIESAGGQAVAAVYPFQHVPGSEPGCDDATRLYELRLHHYVLGLEYAGSPYAHHTLGSCLAVKAEAYTQVRGFPRRAGGEDFYLLNKLVKLGPLAKLQGKCIELESRYSTRVPFGTGPAVEKIGASDHPDELPLFYHPGCFAALRALLRTAPVLWRNTGADLPSLLCAAGLDRSLAQASCSALATMGLAKALSHCQRQGKSQDQFTRQFHQWFDAFRSLKFIHALRDAGWTQQSLGAIATLQPQLWPDASVNTPAVEDLRSAVNRHWGWT